jgi:hypothetical protein
MPYRFGLLLLAVLHACTSAAPHSAPPPTTALGAPAWGLLKRELPGTWTTPTKSGGFSVAYKLISGESALVEEWGPGTPHETETVFYPDHADLLLTHYCAQGNQPRLRVAEVTSDAVVFRFVDVTNRAPDQSMLVERRLRFGVDAFDDVEVYRAPDGSNETTTTHFTRATKGSQASTTDPPGTQALPAPSYVNP